MTQQPLLKQKRTRSIWWEENGFARLFGVLGENVSE